MTQVSNRDGLDQILAAEEDLVPSSGFAVSVMERVREDAAMPEPIPFPWKRVLPGAIVVAIGLAWCMVQLMRMALADARTPALVHLDPSAVTIPRVESIGYVAAALAVSAMSWLLGRRMIGRRGLV